MRNELSNELSKMAVDKGLMVKTANEGRDTNTCSKCGGEATEFRDEISKREYELTVWCQICQDAYFN